MSPLSPAVSVVAVLVVLVLVDVVMDLHEAMAVELVASSPLPIAARLSSPDMCTRT